MNFIEKIESSCMKTTSITTLQVNLGNVCNLTCTHCHVNAGPNRSKVMSKKTVDQVLGVLKKFNFKVLDITGGEPSINPNFKYLIENGRNYVDTIIVRTNLVILEEKGYEDYIDFYVKNKVVLVVSLPCYTEENTDSMRGDDTFTTCISVIKKLNAANYGIAEGLEINLVHNPGGDFLPGNQDELEKDYKRVLGENYGVKFNHLFNITNLPIGRFAKYLKSENLLGHYMNMLEDNYNVEAAKKIMCRSQLSVDYQGIVYDCDFNQMLGLKANGPQNLKELLKTKNLDREIIFGNHCYGCTAGTGFSCGGVLT